MALKSNLAFNYTNIKKLFIYFQFNSLIYIY
jgi:hypothetical protein